jgi:hypothetical protein
MYLDRRQGRRHPPSHFNSWTHHRTFTQKPTGCPIPLLFILLALVDIIGLIYTARQVVTATTIFRDCAFPGYRATSASSPDNAGGAVLLIDDTVGFGLAGCVFEDCRAPMSGGDGNAFYAKCLSLFVGET